MAEGIRNAFAGDLTGRWRALAERRKAHLVGLYDSGRWRLYYSEQDLVARLREAITAVEKWSATEQSVIHEAAALFISPAEAANGVAVNGVAVNGEAVNGEAVNGVHFADGGEPAMTPADAAEAAAGNHDLERIPF